MTPPQGTTRAWIVGLLGCAVVLWAAKYHPFLELPLVFDDDARHHVYWTYKFQDPALFSQDLLTDFISSPRWALFGYRTLYWLGAQVCDPLLFSQLLSLLLLGLCGVMMFRVAQPWSVPWGRAGGAVLCMLYFVYSFSGGFPHSFAFPLLLGFLLALQRQAYGAMAGMVVLHSLFYPPILLNALPLAALAWWRAWQQNGVAKAWRQACTLGLGVGIAGAILCSVYVFPPAASQTSFGRMITRSEAYSMPEMSAQGRTPFYGSTFLKSVLNDRWGFGVERLYGFLGILLLMAVVRWPGRLQVPPLVRQMVWTSFLPYAVAHALLFRLHNPSRYVLYTFPIAAMLAIAVNLAPTAQSLQERWPRWRTLSAALQRQRRWRWVVLAGLACGLWYVQTRYVVYVDPLEVRVDATEMALYRYLESLPKTSRIAGHPTTMDTIPLLARRTVLVNEELSLPYYTGYYAEVRARLQASLEAYYAEHPSVIEAFVRRYAIDYMVLDTRHFAPAFVRGRIYYEPFQSALQPRLATQRHFALLQSDVGERVYGQEPYLVLSVGHLKDASQVRPAQP